MEEDEMTTAGDELADEQPEKSRKNRLCYHFLLPIYSTIFLKQR